jgi:predicted RecA/RadA family phage recombinase
MRNYVQIGDTITVTVTDDAGVKSGDVVALGSLAGVAYADAAKDAPVEVRLEGVFELPKPAGAIAAGAKVYYNPTDKVATTASSHGTTPTVAHIPLGHSIMAAGDTDALVRVRLFQG